MLEDMGVIHRYVAVLAPPEVSLPRTFIALRSRRLSTIPRPAPDFRQRSSARADRHSLIDDQANA